MNLKNTKIAIDCRMLRLSGIGVYIENRLDCWIQNKNFHWLLIGNSDYLKQYKSENTTILHCTIPIFSAAEFFKFPVKEINKCTAFYSPNFNIPRGIKIPIYSTIHDVIFLDVKNLTSFVGRTIRWVLFYRAVIISKTVFTVSQFSKERISTHFSHTNKIKVAYSSIGYEILKYDNLTSYPRFNFNYIIFVGNIKKHKGLKVLLEAFNICIERGSSLKLVIVGSADKFRTQDTEVMELLNTNNENIIFTGYIENSEMYNLITNSAALVQPSSYEGFGLPPLEALYLGKPCIISDIPVFKEIYNGFPVEFFNKDSSADLANKILELRPYQTNTDEIRTKIDEKFNYVKTSDFILENILSK